MNDGSMGESHGHDSADEMESSGNEESGKRKRRPGEGDGGRHEPASPPNRTKSNQRWMKLRTTVQLSGAITSTIQKKPPLKREDSFLKRFSTRQVPELQETVDTGDDGEGDSEGNCGGVKNLVKLHRRRRKKYQRPPLTVVNPDGEFFYYWMFLVTVCVLYNLWTLIVRQSFPELQDGYSEFWLTCDVISDVVFLLDIGVQFRTGYLEQGLMVFDWKKLAGHYMASRAFLLDLGAIFPLELLQYNYGQMPILRCPRFFKVHRVYAYYYIVESRTVYPNVLRVMNLIHILLILAHWFGCFYYLLSEYEGFQGDWVYPYRPGAYATLTRKYLASLYWSTLTLTTIGDLPTPESNAEYVFTIVGYLIGVFIFATIVGQVGNVITNRNANRLEFERLLDGAKTYMRHHKVPGGMKRRVLRWYDYSWSRGRIQGGGDINTALGLLPDKLKTELALHVNLSVLKKVTIFQECQPEFLHDLVLKMKAYIFTPGDLICRKGEVAREMFIIADGILEVMSETGRVLTTMKAGDFFGEIGILNLDGLNKRTADVRSVGYSELFSLSREDVLNAMKDYPEAQEILQSLGRKRLKEAQNMNRAWKNSAGQPKDRKTLALHETEDIGELSNKSRLDKLRLDVKELRNVLRKSGRSCRSKQQECLELEELAKCQEGAASNRAVLSRMPRIYNDDTSYEDDNPPSPPKLGAGLPLLQRLKLLKEKQDAEKLDSKKLVTSTSPNDSPDKREVDQSSLPLLQRILLLKQKDEFDNKAMQNTANMAAQVLASTVRTQVNVPGSQSYKSKNRPLDDHGKPNSKGGVKFRELVKIGAGRKHITSESSTKDVNEPKPSDKRRHTSSDSTEDSVNLSSHYSGQNQDSTDNESWKLIKKAVVQPTCSIESISTKLMVDLSFTGSIRKELSTVSEDNVIETADSEILDDKDRTPSKTETLSSALETSQIGIVSPSSPVGKKLHLAQFIRNAQESLGTTPTNQNSGVKCAQKPVVGGLNIGSLARDQPFPKKSVATTSRKSETGKKYKSIDDLSPEYCGLPFVKKLKILNERQKLAELERNTLLRSCSLDSATGGGEETDLGETLTRSHSEAAAMEVVLRNQQSRKLQKPSSAAHEVDSESKMALQLGSPESNETEERRELKSILKKLSSTTLIRNASGVSESNPAACDNPQVPDIKKLMRAHTVEGYAARHSKLTKSVTFNRVAVESSSSHSTSSSDNVFLESSPNDVLLDQIPTIDSLPSLAGVSFPKSPIDLDEEDNSSFDSSTLVNPDVIPTSISISNVKEEHFVAAASISTENSSVGSPQRYSPRNSSPALVIEHTQNQPCSNYSSLREISQNDKMECIGHFLGEIKQLLEGHLEKIEGQYMKHFQNLEQEVRRRDIIIHQLQKRIQDLEEDTEGTNSLNHSLDYAEQPFLRGISFDTVLHGHDSKEYHEYDQTDNSLKPTEQCTSSFPTLEPSKECTYLNIGLDSSSTDTEDEMKYNYDWEVQMLAQQLTEKEEEGNRRRAVSFDSARPSRREAIHRTRSFDGGMKSSSEQVIAAKSLDLSEKNTNITGYNRSLSIGSLQRTFSSSLRRGFHFMRHGIPPSPDVVPTISRSLRLSSHPPTTPKSKP